MLNHLIRKYQQPLLIVATVFIIIAFVGYWNGGQGMRGRGGAAPGDVGSIYGKRISVPAFQREMRKLDIARILRLHNLIDAAGGQTRPLPEVVVNFAWNSYVIQHAADELGINPTDAEIKAALMNIPEFQTDGAFDPNKYALFINNMLYPDGFTDAQLNEVIHEDLTMKKIMELLRSTAYFSPKDFEAQYALEYQKADVSVIHFNLTDFEAGVQVTDDDVKKVFELRVDSYQTPERRSIKYVAFALSPEEKDLADKDRIEALKKLSTKAADFAQAILEKGAKFDDVAAKFGVTVTTLKPFSADAPDPSIEKVPALVNAAFRATKDDPNSDAVTGPDGFYIMHLEDVTPSRQMTLPEAKPQIVEEIKKSRAMEKLNVKAGEVRNKIQAGLDAGKSFADAAKAEGQTMETYPPFSFYEPNVEKPDAKQIMFASMTMREGQMSDLVQTEDGGVLVHLDKREPIDHEKYEKQRVLLEPQFIEKKSLVMFTEWLHRQTDKANIQVVQNTQQRPAAPANAQ